MLKDLVRKNRSYRGYDESFVCSRELMEELVEVTRFTPSSVNQQPLKYYIAYEKDQVEIIQKATVWAKGLPQIQLPHEGKKPTGFIVICLDHEISDNTMRFQRDVGIVAQTMLLLAAEKGLGGCMIGSFNLGEIKKGLNLCKHLQPMLVVAIGKPAEEIVLTEVLEDGKTNYYRDEADIHYVPKRSKEDLLIN